MMTELSAVEYRKLVGAAPAGSLPDSMDLSGEQSRLCLQEDGKFGWTTGKPEKRKQMPKEKRWLNMHMDYLAENGMKVMREYRFHPTRRWRFDYAFPDYKVAVEFDGLFGGKAHTSVRMVAKDSEKMNQAALLGWIVVRVNSQSLRDQSGYRDIEQAIALGHLANHNKDTSDE